MSDTDPAATAAPISEPRASILTERFVLACILLGIVAGTITGIFIRGSAEVISTIAGSVVSGAVGGITGYYFGSSAGSQAKDATIAAASKPVSP